LPAPQGLYDPSMEHDACGVGFVVDLHGRQSHDIVRDALEICVNLDHRGGCGCDANTGDGAGLFMQLSDKFFRKVASAQSLELPAKGEYAVGMMFMPREASLREPIERCFEEIVEQEGQKFLGWRTVPTNNETLGEASARSEPLIRQALVAKGEITATDDMAFERKLYVIRRIASNSIRYRGVSGGDDFYICSLSSRTISYKGMLTTWQLPIYFEDLKDPDMESAMALTHSRFSTNTFPSWPRAQPYRYMSHNGEINTLRGNVNWMHARQMACASDQFVDDLKQSELFAEGTQFALSITDLAENRSDPQASVAVFQLEIEFTNPVTL